MAALGSLVHKLALNNLGADHMAWWALIGTFEAPVLLQSIVNGNGGTKRRWYDRRHWSTPLSKSNKAGEI